MRTCLSLLLCLLVCNGTFSQGNNVREKVAATYLSQIGVKEATGNNDGPQVEAYLAVTGFTAGAPWCAAFVAWTYTTNDVPNPKSAWSPAWFPESKVIYSRDVSSTGTIPQRGDVFGIYYGSLGRIAHVGFVHQWGDNIVITVEGNTNDDGSREGNRVAMKRRPARTIYKVSRYIRYELD